MIELYKSSKECCGCTACVSICPKNAICMKENEYAEILPEIDKTKCIECHLCERVCDFKVFKPTEHKPEAYAFKNKKQEEVESSQSGGAAAAFAYEVIKHSGVVFGCQLTENNEVIHKAENTLEGCRKFKGSKYVQSDMKGCFKECKNLLDSGRLVLFTGTGCQIHGLLRYLETTKTPTDKLYTMDFICHGVPRQPILKRYLELYEKRLNNKISHINFRDKSVSGWHNHIEKYVLKNGKIIINHQWTNIFYKHIIFRESCYDCSYTTTNRKSDVTVADFWGIDKCLPSMDDNKGTSIVLVHTEKGKELISKINDIADMVSIPLEAAMQSQHKCPSLKGKDYNCFWKKYKKNPNKAVAEFFLPSFRTVIYYPFLKKIKMSVKQVKKLLKA